MEAKTNLNRPEIAERHAVVPKLEIKLLPIGRLNPDPRNPRSHSEKQIQQIAASIESFGFVNPILINKHNQLIAGHGRLLAAKLLGMSEAPAILAEHLTDEQCRAFVIADNKLTENSTWDKKLLGEQLKILSEAEIDFSLEALGFEMGEIDILIEGLNSPYEAEADSADVLPKNEDLPQVSDPGEL